MQSIHLVMLFGVDGDENCEKDDNCHNQYGVKSNVAASYFGDCAR